MINGDELIRVFTDQYATIMKSGRFASVPFDSKEFYDFVLQSSWDFKTLKTSTDEYETIAIGTDRTLLVAGSDVCLITNRTVYEDYYRLVEFAYELGQKKH